MPPPFASMVLPARRLTVEPPLTDEGWWVEKGRRGSFGAANGTGSLTLQARHVRSVLELVPAKQGQTGGFGPVCDASG